MRHTTWLQNRTPTHALNGKTPFEVKHNEKPHLGRIQEFRVAAYVKDLKAGKLDARAQIGRFVGYDSESKGYRIFWPRKRTVSVERNVVFNEKDIRSTKNFTIIPGDPLAEGERDKIIQQTPNNAENTLKSEEQTFSNPQTETKLNDDQLEPQHQSSVPFPTTPDKNVDLDSEPDETLKNTATVIVQDNLKERTKS